MAHSLYKNGEFFIDGYWGTLSQLEERFAFINSIDTYNNLFDKCKYDFANLSAREREYKIYLKVALKNFLIIIQI